MCWNGYDGGDEPAVVWPSHISSTGIRRAVCPIDLILSPDNPFSPLRLTHNSRHNPYAIRWSVPVDPSRLLIAMDRAEMPTNQAWMEDFNSFQPRTTNKVLARLGMTLLFPLLWFPMTGWAMYYAVCFYHGFPFNPVSGITVRSDPGQSIY